MISRKLAAVVLLALGTLGLSGCDKGWADTVKVVEKAPGEFEVTISGWAATSTGDPVKGVRVEVKQADVVYVADIETTTADRSDVKAAGEALTSAVGFTAKLTMPVNPTCGQYRVIVWSDHDGAVLWNRVGLYSYTRSDGVTFTAVCATSRG
jgi:hypothetical protein